MSMDCTASAKLIKDEFGGLDTRCKISSFTFSHRLNLYWETRDAIVKNCDKTYTERDDNTVFDVYAYNRDSILKLKQLDEEFHYGDDFTEFLNELLESEHTAFYIKIY